MYNKQQKYDYALQTHNLTLDEKRKLDYKVAFILIENYTDMQKLINIYMNQSWGHDSIDCEKNIIILFLAANN